METLRDPIAPKVFIVDDDPQFARGLARVINAAGWRTEAYESAAAFLEAVGREPGARGCICLDVRMPGMKGTDLHRALRERGVDLPVIFLTGHGDVPTSVDAMKRGAVDFLEKPVSSHVLIPAIRTAMDRHAAERERDHERREIEARLARLSPREHEVMTHVIAGRLNKQIAADLGISLKTVKAHRAKVMEKTESGSVAALVDVCRAAGIHARVVAEPAAAR